jgi:hypothetical protein
MVLLQFMPAPMYILDEIDATLDLLHTQHIGILFRTRFRDAQFIVVSFKEGTTAHGEVAGAVGAPRRAAREEPRRPQYHDTCDHKVWPWRWCISSVLYATTECFSLLVVCCLP